ncbi:MAG: hypothetical protein FD166_1224 [Bacteroidetes bacterium]|nr:MAG: hypothetical protein FD166_1224 [Bacteroidota bacterium]
MVFVLREHSVQYSPLAERKKQIHKNQCHIHTKIGKVPAGRYRFNGRHSSLPCCKEESVSISEMNLQIKIGKTEITKLWR